MQIICTDVCPEYEKYYLQEKKMKYLQKVYLGSVFVLFTVLVASVSAQGMKIAVPAIGPEPGTSISKETGRAPFFLVFDEKGNFMEAIQNPARNQSGGISRTVVALLITHDIRLIVAESIGDKMKQALTDHRIDFVIKTGAAAEAVKSIVEK